MKRYAWTLFACLLTTGAASADEQDNPDPALGGEWKIVQFVYTPNKATSPVADLLHQLGKNVEIKDGWLRSREPGKKMAFQVTADPKKLPPSLDLKLPGEKQEDDQVLTASYVRGNGQLTVYVGIGDKRPKDRGRNDSQIMIVLIRPPQ